jgi:hypothetical protein
LTLHANCCEAPPGPEIVAVKSCEPFVGTIAEEGASVSDIDGAKLTTAEALAVASATLTAVTVTLEPGVDAGALYSPPEEIVPVTVFPPVTPFTSHVTAELFVPVTIAVNRCEAPAEREALLGETVTTTAPGLVIVCKPPQTSQTWCAFCNKMTSRILVLSQLGERSMRICLTYWQTR